MTAEERTNLEEINEKLGEQILREAFLIKYKSLQKKNMLRKFEEYRENNKIKCSNNDCIMGFIEYFFESMEG